ncbi:MAG: hypothetical protein RR894_03035 [Terrisporobacter sp.]
MDINSKKFQVTINRFQKFSKLVNLLLILISAGLLVFLQNKSDAVIIVLLILFVYISIIYIFDKIKITFLLNQIRSITLEDCCVYEILEKTNEESETGLILGKKYKKILVGMYKVEKYIYDTTLKGKQSEKMATKVVEDTGKKLIEPVENIDRGIKRLKENASMEVLDNIEKEAYLIKDTINELFELSKAVTRTLEMNIEKIDIVSLTRQALIEYENKLEENKIKLKKSLPNNKLFIDGDGDKLWRVFEILLENVLKHSKKNTRSYVEIEEKDEDIELRLINISKNELNMDTSKFYEIISNEKNLGIPIAINLIEAQGGKINIFIDGDMFKVSLLFKNNKNKKERGEG